MYIQYLHITTNNIKRPPQSILTCAKGSSLLILHASALCSTLVEHNIFSMNMFIFKGQTVLGPCPVKSWPIDKKNTQNTQVFSKKCFVLSKCHPTFSEAMIHSKTIPSYEPKVRLKDCIERFANCFQQFLACIISVKEYQFCFKGFSQFIFMFFETHKVIEPEIKVITRGYSLNHCIVIFTVVDYSVFQRTTFLLILSELNCNRQLIN